MNTITREDIVNKARELAEQMQVSTLARAVFSRETGISHHYIYTLFPEGGWTEVLEKAGLEVRPQDRPLTDHELLAEFHRIVSEYGKIPTWKVIQSKAHISVDTIRKRFGGTNGTLIRYRAWLSKNDPNSEIIKEVERRMGQRPRRSERQFEPTGSSLSLAWPKAEVTEYGSPISFRGLQHAPINEQGVVFLFGMVSQELGFIVEAIQAGFPDCEAKRKIDPKGKRWQRVRIEFEYQSNNFRQHGHNPSECDLIVCWEHNWPDCPLEVLELRSVIVGLNE
jgi:hypothetical protein